MLFISPPFGNYINFPNTKSIKGSYTLHPRDGLIMQILKTLRFSFDNNGWINKIGLRNKGLQYGIDNYNHKTDILSIAIMNESEIKPILNMLPEDTNIELNVSCPNINKLLNDANNGYENLGKFLNPSREWCIVKLSPLSKNETIHRYYELGFRQFHCCNTLPVEKGGLSGPALIPYVSNMIKLIKRYNDTIIIAGGGIQHMNTLQVYKKIGASHFSVSTLLFNPYKSYSFLYEFNRKKL